MDITPTDIPEVLIVTPARYGDDRGFFTEPWNRQRMADAGIDLDFVQDNHSFTGSVGTVRGLHFQKPPHAQDKLVRVTRGSVIDVAVDARSGSPTYGQSVSVELSAENGRQLFVPKGFLHGFVTLTPNVDFMYKCSAYYHQDSEGSVYFADPDLGIDWGPNPDFDSLSVKDDEENAVAWADFESPFTYQGA